MKRMNNKGFTLIELMIVVAIVGILAVLAVFGVRKYLANAKSAEATNTIGVMNQQGVQAYEREVGTSELGTGSSAANSHQFCATSTQVPAAVPLGNKYTPIAADYLTQAVGTNDNVTGWKCLGFEMSQPQYYAYKYANGAVLGGTPVALSGIAPAPADETGLAALLADFTSCASGDLDGNGIGSLFCLGGVLDATTKVVHTTTQVYSTNAQE